MLQEKADFRGKTIERLIHQHKANILNFIKIIERGEGLISINTYKI